MAADLEHAQGFLEAVLVQVEVLESGTGVHV